MIVNVLFAGVGGQGIVTASDLLAQAGLEAGWAVRKAESHGMAQRGGSVVSHVRLTDGDAPLAPVIADGRADLLVGLEVLETGRALWMLRPDGFAIVDARRISTAGISSGKVEYPGELEDVLAKRGVVLDATGEAAAMGEPRAANSLLLGVLSSKLMLPREAWERAFGQRMRGGVLELNWALFLKGAASQEG